MSCCIDCKHWGKIQKRKSTRFVRLKRITEAERARGFVGAFSYVYNEQPQAPCNHPEARDSKPFITPRGRASDNPTR